MNSEVNTVSLLDVSRGRRGLATTLVAVLMALAAPVAVPPPSAYAVDTCAVEELTPQQQARLAYVFLGEVTDVAESAKDGVVTRIYTVRVSRWWRGELTERVKVASPVGASDCGLRGVRKGSSYVFMADDTEPGGEILALSYEGTRKAEAGTERKVSEALGLPAQKPVTEPAEPDAPTAAPTSLDDSEPPAVLDVITLPAIVVAVGLVLLALGSLLGRRES